MNLPIISIVMPMYNTEKYVQKAITSILSQTYKDFELLILNDGSTDNSFEKVKQFNDPRIRLFDLPHNYINSLNRGFDEALGKYIIRMDSDDYMYPDRLQKQFDFMENNPNIDVSTGAARCLGDRTGIIKCSSDHIHLAAGLLYGSSLIHGASIIRKKSVIDNHIRYNKEFEYAEDYKLWSDFVMAGCKLAAIPDIIIDYNCHFAQTVQTQTQKMWESATKVKLEFIKFAIDSITGEDKEIGIFFKKLGEVIEEYDYNIAQKPFIDIINSMYIKYLENNS